MEAMKATMVRSHLLSTSGPSNILPRSSPANGPDFVRFGTNFHSSTKVQSAFILFYFFSLFFCVKIYACDDL